MRRLAVALLALAFVGPAQAAICTSEEKASAEAALSAYRKAMPKQRAAYFRRHKKPKQRKAFVHKQRVTLKRLQKAAGCEVLPSDTTPPRLQSASVNGSSLTVAFDEAVVVARPSFTVRVNGAAVGTQSVKASGMSVVLALGRVVGGDDVVKLDYAGGLSDAAGNGAPAVTGVVVANATPDPCSFMVSTGSLHGGQNEGPTDLTVYRPGVGVLRGIVIWVDFEDAPATESIPALTEQVFRPAAAAYAAMSYGKLSIQIDAAPRWYRLTHPSTYYGLNAADDAGRKDEYIAEAVRTADADLDFSEYDVVYLLPAAGASADMATGTQRAPGAGLLTVDGKEIRYAVLVGSDRLVRSTHGSEQIVHETGHVLGLPDLYGDPSALGGWDPMSFSVQPAAELFGWHRWKLGWLAPSQLRCVRPGRTVEATLSPLETPAGVKMMIAPLDATRAVVIENRQPLGLDARLCDKGVVVYTVDGAVAFPGAPVHVLPAHRGTDTDGAKTQRCGPKYDAPLDFGPGEASSLHDAAMGIGVDLVSTSGGSYVVRVSRSP